MSAVWAALDARARGLATHLLEEGRLEEMGRATTTAELGRALRDTPYGRYLPLEASAPAVELAITRSLAERLSVLARWAGDDARALRPVFLAQDALNVRDVLRGAVGALPSERRMARAIPTPLLGRKELEVLSRAETPGAVASTLVQWGHPLGSALLEEARRKHPDAYRLEAALTRRAVAALSDAARGSGTPLRAFVRAEIDAANSETAVFLAGAASEGELGDLFLDGGEAVRREDFVHAASAESRPAAADRLARATGGSVLSAPLGESPASPAALAGRILSARIAELRERSRVEPLSAAPVLLFVLSLRQEATAVRRASWAVALGGGLLS